MSSGKHSNRNSRLARYLTPRRSIVASAFCLAIALVCGIAVPSQSHKINIGAEVQASRTSAVIGQQPEWHHPPAQRPTITVAVHYPYTIVVAKGYTLSSVAQQAYNRSDAWTYKTSGCWMRPAWSVRNSQLPL